MKAFEKWHTKTLPNHNHVSPCMAWRAALEWVLSWETDGESAFIIKQELGNDTPDGD